MYKRILFVFINVLASFLVASLIIALLQGGSVFLVARHTAINVVLLIVFIFSGIVNIYSLFKTRKMLARKAIEITLSVAGIAIMVNSISVSSKIDGVLLNTIVNYSDKACFSFDRKCKVKVENEVVVYRCQSGLEGTMLIQNGSINQSYQKLSIITEFDSVYSEKQSGYVVVQYQITPDKYINIKLKNNKRQIGAAPYKSCQYLATPATKSHTIAI